MIYRITILIFILETPKVIHIDTLDIQFIIIKQSAVVSLPNSMPVTHISVLQVIPAQSHSSVALKNRLEPIKGISLPQSSLFIPLAEHWNQPSPDVAKYNTAKANRWINWHDGNGLSGQICNSSSSNNQWYAFPWLVNISSKVDGFVIDKTCQNVGNS